MNDLIHPVKLNDIEKAACRIQAYLKSTPMEPSLTASKILGVDCYLKLECMQVTGSFKLRGALSRISLLSDEQKRRGVVACSAGNHAQGVARAASLMGVEAHIIMPVGASLVKVQATKDYGAKVTLHGQTVDESIALGQIWEKEKGLTMVHPFEDPAVIAGQGTLGLELLREIPHLVTVVVPIGGGGLISGVAIALKSMNPKIRVVGVVSDRAPGMWELFQESGRFAMTGQETTSSKDRMTTTSIPTIADGIAVKYPSRIMFEHYIKSLVDEIVKVTDDEIAEAMVFLMERAKVIAEGSGAVGLAAALARKFQAKGPTCFIISGGNVDLNLLGNIIQRAQVLRGKISELTVSIIDRPGQLSQMAEILAEGGANILDVRHERTSPNLALREAYIHFLLETRDRSHMEELKLAFRKRGFYVISDD